ncbi:NAD(P)H-quinone oxidoreductase [Naumannella halotolerans]|uniref:Putative PIG3 family NAD(P)H quinone oxidoreductase n=1 Tax=Naumannella halotolerans TaxID=993414 RepID=A0A4R7IYQ4_9ACTN|nr:NAD(P)H-quinone oxidoreductase [Naumannella halotolerans]TDT29097.1 putative PIG3 family NAD(P)H quinone oxidoreductase [Naumannella halotolerans]
MYAVTQTAAGGPDTLTWDQVPDPTPPGPDEVLVKVAAAGVNRADLLQRQGHYPPPAGASTTIGLECSGTIAAVGDKVTDQQIGEPCVALLSGGGYAEYAVVPAGQVIPPPEGVDLVSAGGLLEVAATVLSMTELAQLAAGETFLVHGGAGGIGSFAIQYGVALGARVITTAGSAEKLAYCRELGAATAIDYHTDWVEAVKAEGGADVILDVVGAKYLRSNLEVLRADGRLAIIGFQGGTKGEIDLGALLAKRGSVIAASLRSRPVEQKAAICEAVRETVWPLVSAGRITIPAETRMPITEVVEAHRRLESGDNTGKIILTVD